MRLRIVTVGHKLPIWATAGYEDYARRLPREFSLELVDLKAEPRGRGKTTEQILASEALRIDAATRGHYLVALDERGEPWTTMRFADAIRRWHEQALAVAFVIGSADGLAERIKRDANVMMALSALTLPHGLARILLAEQLYRAASMLQGHPYHRQ